MPYGQVCTCWGFRKKEIVPSPSILCFSFKKSSKGAKGEEVHTTSPEEGSQDDRGKQGEEVSTNLPEDLVGRILAMVPFPFVFKARVLSKAWLAKFSSISLQDEDEEKKRLATSFQKQLSERSTTWNTFCPVFISAENSMAYDRTCCIWRKMPSLSFLSENLLSKNSGQHSELQTEGALLFVPTLPDGDFVWSRRSLKGGSSTSNIITDAERVRAVCELYVANVLTQTWKQLPPGPTYHLDQTVTFEGAKLVLHPSLEMYMVIAFYTNGLCGLGTTCHAEIYDSKVGAWSGKRLDLGTYIFLCGPGYVNGVIYRVGLVATNPWTQNAANHLLAINVQDGTFEVIQMPPMEYLDGNNCLPWGNGVDLVVCNDDLIMIVYDPLGVVVVKIDPGLRTWMEVTRGPPAPLNFGLLETADRCCSCDGNYIFFASKGFVGGMLAYNVHGDEWSCFPCPKSVIQSYRPHYDSDGPLANMPRKCKWTLSSFQPGLNPFMAV